MKTRKKIIALFAAASLMLTQFTVFAASGNSKNNGNGNNGKGNGNGNSKITKQVTEAFKDSCKEQKLQEKEAKQKLNKNNQKADLVSKDSAQNINDIMAKRIDEQRQQALDVSRPDMNL